MVVYVLNVSFVPEDALVVRYFTGLLTLKLLLKLVSATDPELAKFLHSSKGIKPYSCKPLAYAGKYLVRQAVLKPWRVYRAVYTVFSRELLATVLQSLAGAARVKVDNVFVKVLDYSVECVQPLSEEIPSARVVRLDIITPLRFSVRRVRRFSKRPKFRLFPEPELIAKNVARHAANFGFISRDSGVRIVECVRDLVYESDVYIRKESVALTRGRVAVGVTGHVTYTIEELCNETMLFLSLLKYAELSNVGSSRSMGLGVVKVAFLR